jgi:autotransporter-associated beta strand protein
MRAFQTLGVLILAGALIVSVPEFAAGQSVEVDREAGGSGTHITRSTRITHPTRITPPTHITPSHSGHMHGAGGRHKPEPTPAPAPAGIDPTWTGGTNSLWNTSANWNSGAGPVPGAADAALFNGAGNGHTTIDLGSGASILTITFDTSSAAAYTIGAGAVGSQTLTLSLNGAITVNSGVTTNQLFNAALKLGADGTSTGSFTFTNNGTGTLTFAGNVSETTANNNAPARTLNLAGSGNGVISGVINGNGVSTGSLAQPSVSVVKTGTGTWTLSGNNTYNGGTTVSQGTLLVSNTTGSGTGTGNVTVNGSGTTLGGTGTISGSVTLGNTTPGAILNPGPKGTAGTSASVGTLTTGAVTLTGANTVHIDAFGTLATQWDKLVSTGAISLGTTSTLQVIIASGLTFTSGTTYHLLTGTSLTGTFSGITNNELVLFSGYEFIAEYTPTEFDLVVPVPEPGTWCAAALALGVIGYSQRRRFGRLLKSA